MNALRTPAARKSCVLALGMMGLTIAASTTLVGSSRADQMKHAGEKSVIMLPADMKWAPTPALPAGVTVSMLYGDLTKSEPIGFRIKIPKGTIIAPHTHPVHERVTVISGLFALGDGEKFDKQALHDMPAGSVAVFPSGCPMFGFAHEETVIQINAEGPWGITYINPDDDPRKKQ